MFYFDSITTFISFLKHAGVTNMDQMVLNATHHVSVIAKETSKDWLAIVVTISILDSLPVNLVNAILMDLQTLTAISMESVPVKVAMLVTDVINAKVDTT